MSKVQTRRSVSVRGVTYRRLREHCTAAGLSISYFIEDLVARYFNEHAPPVEPPEPPATAAAPTVEPALAPRPAPSRTSTATAPAPDRWAGARQVAHVHRLADRELSRQERRDNEERQRAGRPLVPEGSDGARSTRAPQPARIAPRAIPDPWSLR